LYLTRRQQIETSWRQGEPQTFSVAVTNGLDVDSNLSFLTVTPIARTLPNAMGRFWIWTGWANLHVSTGIFITTVGWDILDCIWPDPERLAPVTRGDATIDLVQRNPGIEENPSKEQEDNTPPRPNAQGSARFESPHIPPTVQDVQNATLAPSATSS
jgi:hypothetical protein